MKIGIITQGSNGDVEMLVSLAFGLIKNKHEVEIFIVTINNRDYSFLNEYPGLTVHQKHIHAEFKDGEKDLEFWNQPEGRKDELFQRIHVKIKRYLADYSLRFAKEKDLIIGSQHIFELICAAEKYDVPFISVNNPLEKIRTKYEPPFFYSDVKDKDIETLWHMYENHHNSFLSRTINQFRRKHDLPQVHNILQEIFTSKFLNLLPYSKHLVEPKPDWNDSYHLSGFLKSTDYNDWKPSPHLLNFIEEGEKPVFITVGSMSEHENDIRNLQNILFNTARLVNRRAIIHSNWEEENVIEDNVYKLKGFISYPQILSKCSLMVHHGGIGALHNATLAGCPSIVIKYGFDQPYNAKLLLDVGISNGSIFRKDLNVHDLAKLINDALNNKSMKQRAEELALLMKSENGIDETVRLIEMKMEQIKMKVMDVQI